MKTRIMLTALMASTLMLVGCSDDDDAPAPQYSYVRVLHASADAPNVDVLVDNQAVLSNVAYQQGSNYLQVLPGTRTLALRVNGTSTIALSEDVMLSANGYYSVIAQNDVASLELAVMEDTARVGNDMTDVTVVHASTGAGNVDVYVTAPNVALPSSASLADVPLAATATLSVAPGDYQVRLTAPGSTTLAYDSGTLGIASDLYAVAVNSRQGASPATLLIWNSSVTPVLDNSAEVRIVHAVDAVDVDVFAGGAPLLTDFSFKDTTVGAVGATKGYFKVVAGDLDVAIAPAGQGIGNAVATLSGTLSLQRGESYTVIAAGDVNDLPATQLIVLTDQRSAAAEASVRLVHAAAAPEADPVDIYVTAAGGSIAGNEPTFADVVIGQDTGYTTLAAGTYDVIIAADGTQTAAVPNTSGLVLGAGSVTTAIAVGASVSNLDRVLLDDLR